MQRLLSFGGAARNYAERHQADVGSDGLGHIAAKIRGAVVVGYAYISSDVQSEVLPRSPASGEVPAVAHSLCQRPLQASSVHALLR